MISGLFWDASALVKAYTDEDGTPNVKGALGFRGGHTSQPLGELDDGDEPERGRNDGRSARRSPRASSRGISPCARRAAGHAAVGWALSVGEATPVVAGIHHSDASEAA